MLSRADALTLQTRTVSSSCEIHLCQLATGPDSSFEPLRNTQLDELLHGVTQSFVPRGERRGQLIVCQVVAWQVAGLDNRSRGQWGQAVRG
jgi:hypothetical protein